MRAVELIQKKKTGGALTGLEIGELIAEYVAGNVPDYQMSALLMAVYFNGMTGAETAALTGAMMESGAVMDLSGIPGTKVDKHSTGGVGDTTTLILAPLVAACGVPVAKISGRGLGHTGGTLDKLESVPGVSVSMAPEDFVRTVNDIGIAVAGQTEDMVPADKKLYALRDVTATVDSVPLIASSIMSKKLASGSDAIVLDVKTGSGAFLATPDDARELSRVMVGLGNAMGRRTVAVISDMDQPLGSAVGNALELREAILALSGEVPFGHPLMQVAFELGAQMLVLARAAETTEAAKERLKAAIDDRSGLGKLAALIGALGGDPACCREPDILLKADRRFDVRAERDGVVLSMNALQIGEAAMLLGAGRSKKTDVIDPHVGIIMKVRVGDRVKKGDPLAEFHVNDTKRGIVALSRFESAITIGEGEARVAPLIYDIIK